MADNKDKKVLNVPALRFPEFNGEWITRPIKDIADFIGGGTPSSANEAYWQGTIPWVSSSDIVEDNINDITISRYITEEAISNSATKLCSAPVILIVSRVGVGKVALSSKAICTSQDFCNLINIKVHPTFLAYSLSQIMKRKSIEVQGTSIKGITSLEIQKIILHIPSLQEQHKISDLFQLIDKRIAVQSKIIEDLKKLKSAIVEALFCAPKESVPAKRLSPYSKDWKLIKLFDICQRIQTKNTGRQCRQVLTIAAQYGLVNQEDFFNKTVASENLERYYLLQKGDFAYNKSYSGDYAWGAIKRLERYEQGVLSPLYICFRPNITKVDADYLAHYFESKKWYKGIADIAGEGARNHGLLNISVIDFFNTIHRIPDLEEQKVIAQFLNKFSSKLSCEQRIMQSLTKQRNYLLQKMFI